MIIKNQLEIKYGLKKFIIKDKIYYWYQEN